MPIVKLGSTDHGKQYRKRNRYSSNNYSNKDAIDKVSHYITSTLKCDGEYGCVGMLETSVEDVIKEMNSTKRRFDKTAGRKLIHMMISTAGEEYEWLATILEKNEINEILYQTLFEVGYALEELYPGHEILFAVHTNTNYIHLHAMINSVNIISGLKISISPADRKRIYDFVCQRIKEIAARKCAEQIFNNTI